METLTIDMKTLVIMCIGIACIVSSKVVPAAESRSCRAPELTRDSVVEIVRRARADKPDLPQELPNASVKVSRDRCFYTYTETPKARHFDDTRVFVINQDGIIVDVTAGRRVRPTINCPPGAPTIDKLASRLAEERAIDPSIPEAPAQAKTEIIKSGCMFLYYETPLPQIMGQYNIYTFDGQGELYKVYVSKGSKKK